MSKTALFLRHAETNLNADPVNIGGRSKWAPLSVLGETQPADTAMYFMQRGITFDNWYSSPAVRALRTGRLLCEALGVSHEPIIDDRLQEMSQGDAEGRPRKEMWNEEAEERIAHEQMDFKFSNGESMREAGERKMDWLNSWSLEAPDASVSLVTAHGLAIRCMVGHLKGWDRLEILEQDAPNCSLTSITFDGDFQVDYVAQKTTDN